MRNNVHQVRVLGAPCILTLFWAALFIFPAAGIGQTSLPCDGALTSVSHTGTHQDFIVPQGLEGGQLALTAKGGDGGFARIENTIPFFGNMQLCRSEGGQGATASANFTIGQGADEIPPGALLRFVVGGKGEDGNEEIVTGTSFQYGGGGGGTAILMQRPDSEEWELLMVAGGGGGAYQGMAFTFCVDNEDGQGGQAALSGGNGNGDIAPGEGGAEGQGGNAGGLLGLEIGGGGGGADSDGEGITCLTIEIPPTVSEVGEGLAGGTAGGEGGKDDGCTGFSFRSGGYGFGGGGAGFGSGGGGGGFSGGGGGGTTGRGGGGGSFVHPMAKDPAISGGGSTEITAHGLASFQCIILNNPPEAVCISTPITIELDDSGTASLSAEQLDGGSSDPDGDELSLSLSQEIFDCSQAGSQTVSLIVEDGEGGTSSCEATVTVVDKLSPAITCPENSSLLCNADTSPEFTGLASAGDNCGTATLSHEDELLEGNCPDEFTIERRWNAADASGNVASCVQQISIIPDDTPPACLNCPDDVIVSCGNIPEVPSLQLSDNCDPAPQWTVSEISTQTNDGSCSDHSYSITRTFIMSDRCGNVKAYIQAIRVVDETAPAITCPENTTVSCVATQPEFAGMAAAADDCDLQPAMDFSDVVLEGDCGFDCLIERTFTATDACGNQSSCKQTIRSTAEDRIDEALHSDLNGDGLSDPIVLGYSRNSLTITEGGADCILGWLPGNGGNPASLPRAQQVVDGRDCRAGIPLSADGKINNPLLAQALLLSVNTRLSPQLGNTQLSNLDCNYHPVLNQFLGNTPSVNNLLRLANLALGNIVGPVPLGPLTDALACINGTATLCGAEAPGPLRAPGAFTGSHIPAERSGLYLFPNPAANAVHLELSSYSGRAAVIRIYNLQGQLVEEQRMAELPGGPVEWRLDNYHNGLYIAAVYIEGVGLRSGEFVVER